MRKFLFIVLILILCVLMYFIVWYGLPNVEFAKTYTEIQDAFTDYQSTLDTLKTKNDIELPAIQSKLDKEYTNSDTDNVIKQYKENKKNYEDLLALQKANTSFGSADIYDIEYIWTTIGGYAIKYGLEIDMDIVKSEADLNSDDYIMCNLNFDLSGRYLSIAEFIDTIELDSDIGFQINNFFMEGVGNTAQNQSKDKNMDTNNIPDSSGVSSTTSYVGASSESSTVAQNNESQKINSSDSKEKFVKASFTVYNVPVNKRNVTNIKSNETEKTDGSATLGDNTSEDEDSLEETGP